MRSILNAPVTKIGRRTMSTFKIPDIIYLICHDDDGELMDQDDEEIVWCEDNIDNHGIKYVRVKEAP